MEQGEDGTHNNTLPHVPMAMAVGVCPEHLNAIPPPPLAHLRRLVALPVLSAQFEPLVAAQSKIGTFAELHGQVQLWRHAIPLCPAAASSMDLIIYRVGSCTRKHIVCKAHRGMSHSPTPQSRKCSSTVQSGRVGVWGWAAEGTPVFWSTIWT